MRFIFWENMVSPHRSAFLRSLAERGHECTLIVDEIADSQRLAMGWKVPDLGDVRIVANPDERTMQAELDATSSETIHVLGGYRSCRVTRFACKRCVADGRRFGICAEPGIEIGWKRYVRRCRAAYDAYRLRQACNFLLAMGTQGVHWYRRVGWSSSKTFPYSYTVEATDTNFQTPQPSAVVPRIPYQILYIGTLDFRKSPDLLLLAIERLPINNATDWRLTLVGDGTLRPSCEQRVRVANLALKVLFTGYLPSDQTLSMVLQSDCVVIPSRHDGWCAVVNEALQKGTPVVCSDHVGASCVVAERPELGDVYPWNDTERLAEILRRRIADGPIFPERRAAIRNWSRCIQGPAVAEYFEQIMRHVYEHGERPVPPWERKSSWEESR